jgi:quercetin dioxygenase-like cupin family protein
VSSDDNPAQRDKPNVMTPEPPEVQILRLSDAPSWSPAVAVTMQAIIGTGAMLNVVELEADGVVPLHSHPHEQIGLVLRGIEILQIAGQEYRLGPLEAYVIPGGIEHGGTGGPDGCTVIDVFQPVREDYRAAMAEAAAHQTTPEKD